MSNDEAAELAEHEARLGALEAANRELRTKLDEQSDVINGLAQLVAKLGEDEAAETRFWWSRMTRLEAIEQWTRMVDWLDEMYWRDYRGWHQLKKCWYRHPQALDVVTAFYRKWTGAYGKHGPYYESMNWQEEVEKFTSLIGSILGGCQPQCAAESRIAHLQKGQLTAEQRVQRLSFRDDLVRELPESHRFDD